MNTYGHNERIIAYSHPWRGMDGRVYFVFQRRDWEPGVNKLSVGRVTWEERKPEDEGFEPIPPMSLSAEAAQELADMLWQCGIRPRGAAGSAGQLSAVENHLNDMRALVFKTGAPK